MIHVVCEECKAGLRISPGAPGEVEGLFESWHPDEYPCFRCGKTAKFVERIDSLALPTIDLHDVTPHEAFLAMNGLGIPAERECGPELVARTFLEKRVKRVSTRFIKNSHRSVVDHLEFEDGTRLFLGASAHGAIVYRISPPHSYVKESADA